MTPKRPPAYRSISNSIRSDIIARRLRPGDRLPVETDLAEHFGVSRSTIREVLRDLATQNLVETTRGATGGTFVVVPRPEAMARSLGVGISMLASNENLTVEQMLEAREVLEVPMTRIACLRATDDEVDEICNYADDRFDARSAGRDLEANWGFHSLIAKAARNPLLELMCEPVLFVLENAFAAVTESAEYDRQVEQQHRAIAAGIRARDADGAAAAMREHLQYLRPFYRRFDARLGR